MFGLAPAATPELERALQSQAVGRSIISGYAENVAFLGNANNDSLILNYPPGSHVNLYDSGAPLFIESNGDLLLLGTNAFQTTAANGTTVNGSGINYIGNQEDYIRIFVINAVPEPSSMILASMAAIAGYSVMRRRKIANRKNETIVV